MRQTDAPAKFPIPFANSAGPAYTHPIPTASQIGITPGAASLTDGFPPLTFQEEAAGGVPPWGQDHNGILQQITAWVRALSAGIPILYDAAFQAAIGGYPANSWIRSAGNPALIYQCVVDNNMSNPDAGGGGWTVPQFIEVGTEGLIIDGHLATSYGAGIRLFGTGGTPNKWIRSINGYFSIVNNAYSAEILQLLDGGQLYTASSITARTGDITAQSGSLSAGLDMVAGRNGYMAGSFSTGGNITAGVRLRASYGARGSGDPNAATILNDFVLSGAGYQIMPNGFIVQWGQSGATGNNDVINFPTAFPNACLAITCSEAGVLGWQTPGFRFSVYGTQIINNVGFYMSCMEIQGTSHGPPTSMFLNPDFGRWIAVGY